MDSTHAPRAADAPASERSADEDPARGNGPRAAALAFLTRRGELTDAAVVGLHQQLVNPGLVYRIVAAGRRGARLAAGVAVKPGAELRRLVRDPAFDWGAAPGEGARR